MYAASSGLCAGATLGFVGSGVTRARYSAEVLSGPALGKMVFGGGSLPLTMGFQRGVVRGGWGISMNLGDSGATFGGMGLVEKARWRARKAWEEVGSRGGMVVMVVVVLMVVVGSLAVQWVGYLVSSWSCDGEVYSTFLSSIV